jgi:hypothetical protein
MDAVAGSETKPLGAVVQTDDGKIRAQLDEDGAGSGGRDVERASGCGGGVSVRSAEVRTDRRSQGHSGWQLGAAAAYRGWRGNAAGSEAAQPSV